MDPTQLPFLASLIPGIGPNGSTGDPNNPFFANPNYTGPAVPTPTPGQDPTAAITAFYQQLLGRAPDAGGLANWVNQAKGGASLNQIGNLIAQSPEAQQRNNPQAAPVQSAPAATSGSAPSSSGGAGGVPSGSFDLAGALQGLTQFAPGGSSSPTPKTAPISDWMQQMSQYLQPPKPDVPQLNFGSGGQNVPPQGTNGPQNVFGYNTSAWGGLPPSYTGGS